MRRLLILATGVGCMAITANADEWKIKTESAGDVTVVCGNPDGWRFDVGVEKENGKEVVTVRLDADSAMTPPRFTVGLSVPQIDTHHLWRPGETDRCQLRPEWMGHYSTHLAYDMPLYTFLGGNDENRLTVVSSEPMRRVDAQFGVNEYGSMLDGKFSYFNGVEAPVSSYETKILLDNRPVFWADAVSEGSEWMTVESGVIPVVPVESAFAPLYSSWYNFHQNVSDVAIERECRKAAQLGMKTIILDDGWQTDDNGGGYAYCGDWEVSKNRFPDFAKHVKTIQDMGMKYMVWYSVPYIGKKSANYERFKGKYLRESHDVGVLDPRFPEVREFLCSLYEDAMKRYGLDGFKLDFIDSFSFDNVDPAEAENYAGRDIKSLPDAINVLMSDVYKRLSALNPDVLVEFRQRYIGPAIRQFGNMLRAADCPGDLQGNRQRIANLRLTSGNSAVHADMLEWNCNDTPEKAARHILAALFGVVQYSMLLETLPENHMKVISHWLDFSQQHRKTLLQSEFRPHHPEQCYPIIEAESADELIVAVYDDKSVVSIGQTSKPVYLINATGTPSMIVELARKPAEIEAYDVYGRRVPSPKLSAGIQRIAVPESGYIKVVE